MSTSIRLTSRSCAVVLRTPNLPFRNVKHLPLEYPITTELFQKRNGYGLNACNNVRDTLHNTDIINSFVKLTELFQKRNGYGLNACNNVRDTLHNTDIINSFVKLIVGSPVGKLV